MIAHRPDEHHCDFEVRCDDAQQVKLVLEYRRGVSQIFALQRREDGLWATTLKLAPGHYRYCFHAYNGRSLTYLTPPNAVMDGLKAALHVSAETGAPLPADRGVDQTASRGDEALLPQITDDVGGPIERISHVGRMINGAPE